MYFCLNFASFDTNVIHATQKLKQLNCIVRVKINILNQHCIIVFYFIQKLFRKSQKTKKQKELNNFESLKIVFCLKTVLIIK